MTTQTIRERVRFVDLQAQIATLQPGLSEAMAAVLDRGDFILGRDVGEFEREFAEYCGVSHALGVDSGFSALELILRGLGIGPGDEVITQANTFIATVSAIREAGAKPVLIDCDEQGNFDVARVEAAITPATRAVIPVHLYGRIMNINALRELTDSYRLVIIEDACQAHGAILEGARAGSFGRAAAFSFYPGKNLGAFGDGGMIVTDDADLARILNSLRNYGQGTSKYVHERDPLNRRLDTLQAAILRVKLPHLDDWNDRRRRAADAYREALRGLPVGLPADGGDGRHVYHLFAIDIDRRDEVRDALAAESIESGIHYPVPCHLQPTFADLGLGPGSFPVSERHAERTLSLPMYPELPMEGVHRVADVLRRLMAS